MIKIKTMTEQKEASAIVTVLKESKWIGITLAKAYLNLIKGIDDRIIVGQMYNSGSITISRARELLPEIRSSGFIRFIPRREKLGSAENPITKLFPAAITEQQFLTKVDLLREKRPSLNYEDQRYSGHTLADFKLIEAQLELPINVKNAGTRFEKAKQLVGIEPDDCIPIPVYKAYNALDKIPNLLYAISVDYSLIETINRTLIPLFNEKEKITWEILNSHSGSRIRDAEDRFVYGMTLKYWEKLQSDIIESEFRLISARKAIRILQNYPKRTPGIGLRAWGTGASAEVNVHISISQETKSWDEICQRIYEKGLEDIIKAVNRKRTELVYDPEI